MNISEKSSRCKSHIKIIAAIFACAALIFACAAPVFAASLQEYAESSRAGEGPYLITVNTRENVVTVYGMGEDGFYSLPIRSMICSAGKSSSATPLGTFKIYGERYEWRKMVDGSYGQYAVRFNGSILFHSICYYAADPSRLMSYEYDALGSNASLGCVRLQVADAKWIYDNCPVGTTVRVASEDGEGPLGKPSRRVDAVSGTENEGWDPTDPREDNPWRAIVGEGSSAYVAGAAEGGEGASQGGGALQGGGASPGGASASGASDALPFADVRPSDWFYESALWCYERSVLKGPGKGFEPKAPVSHAMLWQLLYQIAGEPGRAETNAVQDAAPAAAAQASQGSASARSAQTGRSSAPAAASEQAAPWYASARAWCLENGIVHASGGSDHAVPAGRQDVVKALYRYHGLFVSANPENDADLSVFSDADALDEDAAEAFGWAVAAGIIEGDTDASENRTLRPEDSLSRAEIAAILQRYGSRQ